MWDCMALSRSRLDLQKEVQHDWLGLVLRLTQGAVGSGVDVGVWFAGVLGALVWCFFGQGFVQ